MFSPSASSTRASSLIALLVLASGISARMPEYRLQCLSTEIASCGDKGSITNCLGNLQTAASGALLSQVETCYLNAGCNEAEAETEAAKALAHCDPATDDADLRKREGVEGRDTASAPAAIEPATTANPGPTTTAAATTTTRAVVRAATTTTPLGLAHSGRPIVCYTTSLQTVTVCPVQSTGASSGHVLSCFPTTVPTSVCAAGLICVKDSDGNPSCMFAYNQFDAAGIAIAIFFAVAVASAVALIATLCYREKRAHKRAEAAAVAAEAKMLKDHRDEAGASVAGASGRDGDFARPLMNEDLRDDDGAGYAGGLQQGEGPFGDQHRVR